MGGPGEVLGPVQVLLIGLDVAGADRMLAAELQDLHSRDGVRALDVLPVRRGPDGAVRRLDPLDHCAWPGTLVEALLVSDPGAPEDAAAEAGEAEAEGAWRLADRLPRGATAAILLIEHRWAIPLREAANNMRAEIFGDAWVHPRDLAAARRAVGSIGQ
ncbi:MAG TPA: hypothetical protein VHA76_00470 [Solirubrobacterales bacterium]|nr:hypothetical protein [Solirubrobacterales bacterium]